MSVEMKDSGIAWIGYVPKHWEVTRLKNVFCEYNVKSENGAETLLSLSQYTGVKPKSETELAGSHEAESYEGYKIVKAGQLVMNIMLAWNGSYALSDYDGMISPAYCIYDFRTVCHKKYFHYLLRIDGYPSAFKTMSRGIIDSRLRLYPEQFYTFNTVVPPIDEQSRIANFLDKKCAEIDELIALQEQMIAQLNTYKQAVITETVTKGLDPNVKMKDSGVEWIGDIPEHWDVVPVKYLGRTQNGISKGGDYFGEGYPFVNYGDIYKNYFIGSNDASGLAKSTKEDQTNYSVVKGDVFFTRTSETIEEIGFSCACIETINNATFSGFLIRFRPYANILHPIYSGFYFRSTMHRQYFVKEMNIVTRTSLGQELLKGLPVLLPPLVEQQSIANYLGKKCKEIDELISIKKDKIEQLKAYKKSVIFEYVTGKKQVI